jgi:hypothetical protein
VRSATVGGLMLVPICRGARVARWLHATPLADHPEAFGLGECPQSWGFRRRRSFGDHYRRGVLINEAELPSALVKMQRELIRCGVEL